MSTLTEAAESPPTFADAQDRDRWQRLTHEQYRELIGHIDTAWGLIANVSGGCWSSQADDWRQAAQRWRDEVFSGPSVVRADVEVRAKSEQQQAYKKALVALEGDGTHGVSFDAGTVRQYLDGVEVPAEVHEGGWQWRPIDADTAFAPPFGTIRTCRHCDCLVAGGPTACARCAGEEVDLSPVDVVECDPVYRRKTEEELRSDDYPLTDAEALVALADGKRVARQDWLNHDYLVMREDGMSVDHAGEVYNAWSPGTVNVRRWRVVESPESDSTPDLPPFRYSGMGRNQIEAYCEQLRGHLHAWFQGVDVEQSWCDHARALLEGPVT